MPAKKQKRKPGRPAKPPGERAEICSTRLSAAAREHCIKVGDGSLSRGMRLVIDAAAAHNPPRIL